MTRFGKWASAASLAVETAVAGLVEAEASAVVKGGHTNISAVGCGGLLI